MRLHYYKFPENTPEETLLKNGCCIVLKNGNEVYKEHIPQEHRDEVDHVDLVVSGTISYVKSMIKKYGGTGWTEHIDRDGSCFEVSEIKLSGNNSYFKYNKHL